MSIFVCYNVQIEFKILIIYPVQKEVANYYTKQNF